MADVDPADVKIEFPCDYPIKILGRQCEEFHATVLSVVEMHSPDYDRTSVNVKQSSKGTFSSLTVTIIATGPEQLEALHQGLKDTGLVTMVM
jgi:putative lipoic acid-binding regulatory protein